MYDECYVEDDNDDEFRGASSKILQLPAHYHERIKHSHIFHAIHFGENKKVVNFI